MINFEDFKKLDLKVARIIEAERIENSEKLLKLKIDLGDEKRQIVAGLGKTYSPETLRGKEIVVIINLEPRRLLGIESQGMLLAADNNEPILLIPEKEVPPGTKIR
ncbi:methionine--tRNA ligase subunit beta [Candidatus Jorgensenbacteria bacterium CG_4_10_14_0_8_um_filter_39_13]|uniref:Methionine--tRNA ligase n=2 Tax=Candidatus Joergenseniibacteriota TaxID=1752739 RepID=A0A2M7RJH2_9BACT|nr:MAG: methionine--tRNA ligase subunit beta [Candidatus Jorgensenbacteria bacterium CG11_big_fil_rev_8_21_14_0_20_38_23]PIV13162.1 MAG: methionine--tRNA ligase subunit beta [Candidatus Jorgensenbacteria bacterium CG03_land_8_20_14_0_80_38_39]PIY96611.1 MAG: methionine--tRNA ligase subunit beta [Candidatus Jorgensenbacteria bacterium CG_4_10_14_0_8_um_filter_39_13]